MKMRTLPAVLTAAAAGAGGFLLAQTATPANADTATTTQPVLLKGLPRCSDVQPGQPCSDSVYTLFGATDGYGNPIATIQTDGGLKVFGDQICVHVTDVSLPTSCLTGRATGTQLKHTKCLPHALQLDGKSGQIWRCRKNGTGYDQVTWWKN
jgi:hypothetical protein